VIWWLSQQEKAKYTFERNTFVYQKKSLKIPENSGKIAKN